MNSVAPVWDGNETWLVLGGGGLFAAFPLAYAIIMPAVYPPIIAMLLALVFRGVAFEYRWRTVRRSTRWFWDSAFFGASLMAALSQGIILGALLQGIEVEGRSYAGGWLDWLTPFSLLCGAGVICGYALLGACWLVLKTVGEPHRLARRLARRFGLATVGFVVAVSLATPFLEPVYFSRWFTWPTMLWLSPVPLAVLVLAIALARTLLTPGRDWLPFVLSLALFGLCFAGLGASMWPWVIPTEVTLVGRRKPLRKPALHVRGCRCPDPADPDLYRLRLLGLPRQARPRAGLPLMGRRLVWFVALWIGGVASLGDRCRGDPPSDPLRADGRTAQR